MGALTRAQIVQRGLLLASNTSLTLEANYGLNQWLRDEAMAWPYPGLFRRIEGVALATGARSLSFGAGAGGESLEVQRVRDPLWLYTADRTTRFRPRIRQLLGGDSVSDETVNYLPSFIGMPSQFKVRADTALYGKWSLIPTPVPDKAYLLAIDYEVIPADVDVSSAGDSTRPWFPSDRVMIQAVRAWAHGYKGDEIEEQQVERLQQMTLNARGRLGSVEGTNDILQLDAWTFR